MTLPLPTPAERPARGRRGRLHPLSVAPMMDRTDRHYRFMARRLTRRALLYTEMVHTGAILRGEPERHLAYDPSEHPLALQLGGSDPRDLAAAARIAWERGYDEVDLNVGCPSARVQEGSFGVCLMARPKRVAEAVAEMRAAVPIPVTVKHRIGFDELDRYEDMARFVDVVAGAGCDRFIVHARKAWLTGLDPKQNRTVPPLRYAEVHRLKRERPELAIEINGGFVDLASIRSHLPPPAGTAEPAAAGGTGMDGVMVGRAAYDDPYLLASVDRAIYGDPSPPPTRREVIEALLPYLAAHVATGGHAKHVTRHLHGLIAGRPGARAFRRHLAENAHRPGTGAEVLEEAMAKVPAEVLDERA